MLDFYSLGDYFLTHLKPLGDWFFTPFEHNEIYGLLKTIADASALVGNPIGQFMSGFLRELVGVPIAYVLFGSGLLVVVVLRLVKFALDVIPVI